MVILSEAIVKRRWRVPRLLKNDAQVLSTDDGSSRNRSSSSSRYVDDVPSRKPSLSFDSGTGCAPGRSA